MTCSRSIFIILQYSSFVPQRELLIPQRELLVPRREVLVPRRELLVPRRELFVPKKEFSLPQRELFCSSLQNVLYIRRTTFHDPPDHHNPPHACTGCTRTNFPF